MKRQECPGAMSVTQSCCHVGPSISIIDSFNSEKEINQTAKIDECTILAAGHSGALLERAVHPTEALETAYTPYNHCHISPTWTLALLFHWFLKRHLITKNSRYTGLEAEIFGGGLEPQRAAYPCTPLLSETLASMLTTLSHLHVSSLAQLHVSLKSYKV